jgi:hypothetical protein
MRWNRLSHERTELRAVRYHKKAPDEGKRRDDPHLRPKKKADEKAAGSAGRKGDCHEMLTADAIRRHAAPDAPRAAHRDGSERNE